MQQGVLTVYHFKWEPEGSIGKLIGQCSSRSTDGVAAGQSSMLAEQNDVLSIVVFQIAIDVASFTTFEMIFKHFQRRADFHS